MLEFLTTELLWWHWIALGLILLIMEMFTGTFILLGLGLSAIILGVLEVLYPLALETQLLLWLILSTLSISLWFKYMKDKTIETVGQSNDSLNTLGVVEEKIVINGRGLVRFDSPVLGNSTWISTAKDNLEIGTRIRIVEVKGQLIEVESL